MNQAIDLGLNREEIIEAIDNKKHNKISAVFKIIFIV
jgi:hypothetical protein